jgi:CHASE2 domain-containing sensor protein
VTRRAVAAALALAVSTVVLVAFHLRLGAGLQESASDSLSITRAARPAASTVIVGIDQRSHQTLVARHGSLSQWQRTLYAHAIDTLAEAGARVIGLAVFFDSARPEDVALEEAMGRAGKVVIPVVAQGPQDLDLATRHLTRRQPSCHTRTQRGCSGYGEDAGRDLGQNARPKGTMPESTAGTRGG